MANAEGKYAVITGGNTGIGYETAKGLCANGYRVTIACKSRERANEAIRRIRSDPLPVFELLSDDESGKMCLRLK